VAVKSVAVRVRRERSDMPKAAVEGLEMYYEVHGAGAPLVFISPLSGDHAAWAFQVPAFVDAGFQCMVFDNRDAGQTSESALPGYTMRQFADDTVALMDAAGFGPSHVVGGSMGGMIAQEIAAVHPERVVSLTLVSTVARTDDTLAGLIRGWKTVRPQCSSEEFFRLISPWLFTYRFFEQPEPLQAVLQMTRESPFPQTPAGFGRQCEAIVAHDVLDRLPTIAAPSHVIGGTEDVLTPVRYSREIAGAIPGARLTEVPGAGHALFAEMAPIFNETVLGFLKGLERPANA
jgi:pimeloyl-ACP methyl ester carboxylesterase